MQLQLLKYCKSEIYWSLHKSWKVTCYTVNISTDAHAFISKHTATIHFSVYLTLTWLKILAQCPFWITIVQEKQKQNRHHHLWRKKENTLPITNRLWRLLKFLILKTNLSFLNFNNYIWEKITQSLDIVQL